MNKDGTVAIALNDLAALIRLIDRADDAFEDDEAYPCGWMDEDERAALDRARDLANGH